MPSSPQTTLPEIDLSSVIVVIPALNEEASIPMVLADLPAVRQVIVVNNGSTDRTVEIAQKAGAMVVDQPQRGYGAACLKGIATARELAQGQESSTVIVFCDADYSDHVHLLPKLVAPIQNGQQDFVLGSRLLGEREKGAMPPQSVYGNKLACGLMNFFLRGNYTDLGPFRALTLASLNKLQMVDENFGWTIEMQIKALKHKLRTIEVAVPYRCRVGSSKISGTISGTFRAGSKILYSIWRYR